MDKQTKDRINDLYNIVKTETKDGNLDSALNAVSAIEEECGKASKEKHTTFLGGILSYKGSLLTSLGRFAEAHLTLVKALEILESQNETWSVGVCHHYQSVLFRKMERYEDAEREALLSLQASGETDGLKPHELSVIAHQWINLGDIHSSMGKEEQAIDDYLKALDIRKRLADKDEERQVDVAVAYMKIQLMYSYLGKDEEARQNAIAALAIYEQIQARGKKDCSEAIESLRKWL